MNEAIFVDKTNGRLQKIQDFAQSHPNGSSLEACFSSLEKTQENSSEYHGPLIELHNHWAPMSLIFVFPKTKFMGGIIYHGSVEEVQINPMAITLESTDGWQVHT